MDKGDNKKVIDIHYSIDDQTQVSTVSFMTSNNIKTLKNIIAISTGVNLEDYDTFIGTTKIDSDLKKLIEIVGPKISSLKLVFQVKKRKYVNNSRLLKSYNSYNNSPTKRSIKRSHSQALEAHEKAVLGQYNYPYCVTVSNAESKEDILKKLEIFFEEKRVPRLFKCLDMVDYVEILFQVKDHAEEFKKILLNHNDRASAKEKTQTKHFSKDSLIVNLIDKSKPHKNELASNISSSRRNYPSSREQPRSILRKTASVSILGSMENVNGSPIKPQITKSVPSLPLIKLKSPTKTKIKSVISQLYGNVENEGKSLRISEPFVDLSKRYLDEQRKEKEKWLSNKGFDSYSKVFLPRQFDNLAGAPKVPVVFRSVDKSKWVAPEHNFIV